MRQIKRITWLIMLPMFLHTMVMAQTSIKGKVTGANNQPVSNATVAIKGKAKASQTDAKGEFTIMVTKGETLVFSSVGFISKEIKVAEQTIINVKLTQDEGLLEGVVVTAMDIKKNPRELGYSVQKVDGDDIQETQRENFVNSLQGRVAGLTINPTSGAAGASSSIVLRGFNSLSMSNQPLFVVDGIVVDNQSVDETSDGGRGIGLASDRPNRNSDYQNRIADINPSDIENVTVLKGPEATALYGSQASSGAILITTKRAKTSKLQLQYDNSFRVSQLTRFPETFDKYSNGTNGVAASSFRYFGPEYGDTTLLYDNVKLFFRPGISQTHNLGMDFGIKNSFFRLSGSIFDQQGVVPNNDFKRYNLRLSNTTKIGKYIELMPSVSLIRTDNNKVLRSAGGYMLSLMIWPNKNNILNYEDPVTGDKLPLFSSNPNSDYDNPFFNVYNNVAKDVTMRATTSLGININPTSWLSVQGRFGYDTYNIDGYMRYHPKSYYLSSAVQGTLDNYWRKYNGYNHTITATAKKKVGDFSFRGMVGTMWQDYQTKMYAITGNTLSSTESFDSSITAPNSRVRLLRNYFGEYNKQILRQFAYFGEAAVSYKNMLFLNYTHRFESASTLPEKNRNYNYPGGSLSIIASDLIKPLKNSDIISYWKIRTSLAGTARLNTPYSTQSVFVNNFASGNGFSYGFTNANPELAPERQSTYELGTEFRLFRNKLNLEATYYNTLNKGQIIENFRLSYGTGFVLNTQNAASTRNQGVEITLGSNVINKAKFGWNFQMNFNKMWNKVIDMPKNVAEYYIADTWLYGNARGGLVFGGPTTSITGFGYERNLNGDVLINPANGLPVVEQLFKIRGDRNPDFTLGINNSFRLNRFRLNFLWDIKVGGDIFNGTHRFLTLAGKSPLTADRFTPRVVKGVLKDGRENTNPTPNTIVIIPALNDAYYTNMPEEDFIEKNVNWLRLRDLTFAYALPKNPFKDLPGIKTLEVFLTVNDLVLITNYTGADPAVNGNTAGSRGVGGFGFDYGTMPAPISFNFGLKTSF
jgi:TonB-linked SusC/RagA family outer membrane protein